MLRFRSFLNWLLSTLISTSVSFHLIIQNDPLKLGCVLFARANVFLLYWKFVLGSWGWPKRSDSRGLIAWVLAVALKQVTPSWWDFHLCSVDSNSNRGAEQIKQWTGKALKTVHCTVFSQYFFKGSFNFNKSYKFNFNKSWADLYACIPTPWVKTLCRDWCSLVQVSSILQ